ALWGVFPVL
nr:Chain C, RESIDUE PEPTIDE [synthetic construct]1I7T_F Chain F, RESIDUE PEPTIDE [synthetic construct]